MRAGVESALFNSVFWNIPHYIHASLLRILYASKRKTFGVKPQEIHRVTLKIKGLLCHRLLTQNKKVKCTVFPYWLNKAQ